MLQESSDIWQLDFLVNILFRFITEKDPRPALLIPCEKKPQVLVDFSHQVYG